jgi:peptide chain release factor subunit 1
MSALPAAITERDARDVVARLAAIQPGNHWVVSCYLKLEPRDRARGKYLIKMKNRVKAREAELSRQPLSHQDREGIAHALREVLDYLEEPSHLPRARGVAIFASRELGGGGGGLFEVLPLPHVHRSRLAVAREPLVRELLALEEEFGTILAVVYDRMAARFFEITAYDTVELPAVPVLDASRAGRFHGASQRQVLIRAGTPSGSAGEHNYHQRIRTEKQRLYAQIADRIFQANRAKPLSGLVLGSVGVDAGAVIPHLHSYVHDLVLGVVKLAPKKASAAEVREAALALREARERAWERAHADAVKDGAPRGWAVNGTDATLKALARGQVRTLLADGHDEDHRIDEAVEEALGQRAQVDVLYDDKARRVVDGLAALLRFRS